MKKTMTGDATGAHGQVRSQVRLSVTRVDLADLTTPGTLLLDLTEESEEVADRAIAWAQVQGFEQLIPSLKRVMGGAPPASGFVVVVNKPYQLLVLATWPWCPTPVSRA